MKYKQILLDFDGVVCDSNGLKGNNILEAAKMVVDEDRALKFYNYFTGNNGIPRNIKLNIFFNDAVLENKILENYEALNSNLLNAPLVPGIEDFLEINKHAEIIIISGGVEKEIRSYLENKSLEKYISRILCGPATKESNMRTINISGDCVFIGDALHDYEVAQQFSIDFIFIYNYTQFREWESYNFSENVLKFKDFNHLNQFDHEKN